MVDYLVDYLGLFEIICLYIWDYLPIVWDYLKIIFRLFEIICMLFETIRQIIWDYFLDYMRLFGYYLQITVNYLQVIWDYQFFFWIICWILWDYLNIFLTILLYWSATMESMHCERKLDWLPEPHHSTQPPSRLGTCPGCPADWLHIIVVNHHLSKLAGASIFTHARQALTRTNCIGLFGRRSSSANIESC